MENSNTMTQIFLNMMFQVLLLWLNNMKLLLC